jgi:hypothetical protein
MNVFFHGLAIGMMLGLPLLAAEEPVSAPAAKPAVAAPAPRPVVKGRPARAVSASTQLGRIMVPEAKFDRDMTFAEVVDWFRKTSKRLDPAGKGIIFVIQDKPKAGETPLEEMRLGSDFTIKDQSLKQLLDRVMGLYGWQILYTVDEYSVNFKRKH